MQPSLKSVRIYVWSWQSLTVDRSAANVFFIHCQYQSNNFGTETLSSVVDFCFLSFFRPSWWIVANTVCYTIASAALPSVPMNDERCCATLCHTASQLHELEDNLILNEIHSSTEVEQPRLLRTQLQVCEPTTHTSSPKCIQFSRMHHSIKVNVSQLQHTYSLAYTRKVSLLVYIR